MPTIREIHDLATELHNKKLLNLDVSAKDLLALQSSLLQGKDPSTVGWYVLGGDHYVLIVAQRAADTKVNPAEISVANK